MPKVIDGEYKCLDQVELVSCSPSRRPHLGQNVEVSEDMTFG